MKINVITLFPEMIEQGLNGSMMGRAQAQGHVQIEPINFREFSINKHQHVDDYPYGGGAGMLLMPEPIVKAIEQAKASNDQGQSHVVLMDPGGEKFNQKMAQEWSKKDHLVLICGHYEGFDDRIRSYVDQEVSIGDFVVTGGELPAMVMIDATVRLLDNVLGNEESAIDESHSNGLLEYPQYTRPRTYDGLEVPAVLLSGHHQKIEAWRHRESLKRTLLKRPDLLETYPLTKEDLILLEDIKNELSE
ncbi:tRNA (guanosine(37)-N1)-methyltransferase TrmD [Atopobacter phocae]|uniref:tRNA (guanosine(37)-N1)-methyltransferase TrmD n=1 Tax=Atopobacter phocae TaxID=136492 RepID=UPI000471DC45|nr:tRNA (guanosine(37)-N1)-methyltransferase TrmD [Atopobacter phocae]